MNWSRIWALILVFVALGCGPCASVRKDYDEVLRRSLAHVAMGDRVALTAQEHFRVVWGTEAFAALSARALRERATVTASKVVSIPAASDTRGGSVTLDVDLRLERVNTRSLHDPTGLVDVELQASLQTHARFEIPGQRSRWSWTSPVVFRAPLAVDAQGASVTLVMQDAELVSVEPRFSWAEGEVPASVVAHVQDAVVAIVHELWESVLQAPLPVLTVGSMELPRVSLPLRVQAVSVDERSGAVALSIVSALRPAFGDIPYFPVAASADYEGVLVIPTAVLNAALRQQTLRQGSVPTVVTEDGRRWQALWVDGEAVDGVWRGAWGLWCMEPPYCHQRVRAVEVRPLARDGRFLVEGSALEAEGGAGEDAATEATATESIADLAALVRLTMSSLVEPMMQMERWTDAPVQDQGWDIDVISAEITPSGLQVRFQTR